MRISVIALAWSLALTRMAMADRPEIAPVVTNAPAQKAGAASDHVATPTHAASLAGVARGAAGKGEPDRGKGSTSDPPSDASARGNDPPTKQMSLGEVVVTAQRYSELAYNVPINLTVLTGEDLQRMDLVDMQRLQYFVPGLVLNGYTFAPKIYIDGVADSTGNGSQVSEYMNDADVTASPSIGFNLPSFTFYDLARVEVLRGPQGTAYGEGAEGGAIHLVTNKPNLEQFEADLRTQLLFTAGGQPSQRFFPVLNIPISESFAIRVTGQYSHDGGWIDQPTADVKGVNPTDVSETRLEALWRVSSQLHINFTQVYHNRKYAPGDGESTNGTIYDAIGLYQTPYASEDMYLSNLAIDYTIPTVATLTSSTTWLKSTNVIHEESASEPASLGSIAFQFFPAVGRYQHYAEELRLHHGGSGHWEWVVGGMAKRVGNSTFPTTFCIFPYGTSLSIPVPYPGLPTSVDSLILGLPKTNPSVFCLGTGQDVQSKSVSEYGNVSYRIADRATVAVGVRHFRDEERDFAAGTPGWQARTFESTDPSASILYRLSTPLNVYARAAEGFRSGGFNGYGLPPYEPESLWNYALGAKTRGLAQLTASVEAYYSRWNDVQLFSTVKTGPLRGVDLAMNGGGVRIKGVDASAYWRMTGTWTLGVSGNYVNSRWETIEGTQAAYGIGDPLDYVPRYEVNASVQKSFGIKLYNVERPAHVRLDYAQRAPWTERNRPIDFYVVGDHLYQLSVEAGVDWSDNLSFGVQGENLLNDRGLDNPDTVEYTDTRLRPMTVGVYFNATFE